jgi:membrane protein DedA with SNARE-associated domain
MLDRLLELVEMVPVETVYLLVGAGAAVENVFPPVPSDTFVVLGGVLADRGFLEWELVLAVAWIANLTLGCFVYLMGRRYGRAIFETRWGRWLLRPHQLQRMAGFYEQYGTLTILVSRFFPVFRVLVPAFAGISRLGFVRTAAPMGIAAAAWYAALVWAGVFASRNVPRLVRWMETANVWLLAGAGVLALALGTWWWRTRRHDGEHDGDPEALE